MKQWGTQACKYWEETLTSKITLSSQPYKEQNLSSIKPSLNTNKKLTIKLLTEVVLLNVTR